MCAFLDIHQAYNMLDVKHKIELIWRYCTQAILLRNFLKRLNCYLIFLKTYSLLWRHLEISSVFVFQNISDHPFLLCTLC